MAADAKKIILIVLYSIIALSIIVALALLLKIPAQKPQPASVAIQAPVTEPPKTVQETIASTNETTPAPDGTGTVISIVFNNQESTAKSGADTTASEKPATSIPVPAQPAPVQQAQPKPAATAAAKSNQAVKPTVSQTAQSKTVEVRYWIQVASFSTKLKAEDMQRMLAEKSLTSYLVSSVVNGKTWYRVRIGPFNSKTDAERWLSTIKNIPDCNDAFIISQQ